MNKRWSFAAAATLATAILTISGSPLEAADDSELSNKVVVIVDGSGSYSGRQSEALERAGKLLDEIAAQRLKRWDRETDQIAIISLDAMPNVLWEGSARDLKAMDRRAWTARFAKRSDFASCTDVTAAFRLAVRHLAGDSRYFSKYLFVFSDLVDEPPTTSLRSCRRPGNPSLPGKDFPWEELKGVSVTALWVPAEQTLAWRRAVAAQGLENTFAIHTDSESAEVKIAPPPRPVHVVSDAERAVSRQRVAERIRGAGRWLGVILAALAGFVILVGVTAAVFRHLRRSARPVTVSQVPSSARPRPQAASPRLSGAKERPLPRAPQRPN
jgi:hypothetical protein